MDINSLLSPQESSEKKASPASQPGPKKRARPHGNRRTGSGLSQEITFPSPSTNPPRSVPQHSGDAIALAQRHQPQSNLVSPLSSEIHMNGVAGSADCPALEIRSPRSNAQFLHPSFSTQGPTSAPQMETSGGKLTSLPSFLSAIANYCRHSNHAPVSGGATCDQSFARP